MVAALIEQYDYIDECVVTSMNYEALKGIKQINPKIQTGYVLNVAYGNFIICRMLMLSVLIRDCQ